MTMLIKPLADGKFELLDGDLLFLYPDINPNELIALSEADYAEFCQKGNAQTSLENGKLVYTTVEIDTAAEKARQQTQAWEAIKAKRQANGEGGVFVSSVKKWFHTDLNSRQQYIFMRTLADFPETPWKTLDNSFVPMTRALLDELSLAMFAHEQADFQNAERHRLAMLKAENPLAYDFSDGWADIFKETDNAN